ncbi:MAG: hypothetical protein IJ228_12085 [Succinivibrio sp.]|nr:hypothetical protein [Succinivibrio sp.]
MYSGFRLNLPQDHVLVFDDLSGNDIQSYEDAAWERKKVLLSSFKSFMRRDGKVDATRVQKNWFSAVDSCHIFLSHSHERKPQALKLAAWLYREFKLFAFVDSKLWGYADELLGEIDDDLCLNPGDETYSYQCRNVSTSHVHMMLSCALMQMIDECECFLSLAEGGISYRESIECVRKLNEDSGSVEDESEEPLTYSPWIYAETEYSRLLRRRKKESHRPLMVTEDYRKPALAMDAAIKDHFFYTLDIKHLTLLNEMDLIRWQGECDLLNGAEADDFKRWQPYRSLDVLYELKHYRPEDRSEHSVPSGSSESSHLDHNKGDAIRTLPYGLD